MRLEPRLMHSEGAPHPLGSPKVIIYLRVYFRYIIGLQANVAILLDYRLMTIVNIFSLLNGILLLINSRMEMNID